MFEPNEVLQALSGRGTVSAEGVEPVRVRYRVVVERRDGRIVASGRLVGSALALRAIWLSPDASLRLKNGREIAVSVTDLDDDTAVFESTGPVARV